MEYALASEIAPTLILNLAEKCVLVIENTQNCVKPENAQVIYLILSKHIHFVDCPQFLQGRELVCLAVCLPTPLGNRFSSSGKNLLNSPKFLFVLF